MTNLESMIAYSTSMLNAIGAWLSGEPFIYLYGLLMGCFVINIILSFINFRRE